MKYKQFYIVFAIILSFCATGTITAKSWRVNNNVAHKAHFTDLNAAMNSADVQDGDTLYLDPGCSITSNQTVTKTVTIVGPGYFMDAFPYNEATISGSLYLKAENCKIEGVSVTNTIILNAPNVTIERCKTSQIVTSSSYPSDNATIRSCYVSYGSYNSISGTNNWKVENCIIVNAYSSLINGLKNSIIRNNTIVSSYSGSAGLITSCEGCEITNNILIRTYTQYVSSILSVTNCVVSNNVMSGNTNTQYPNNKFGATKGDVFVPSGTNDLQYKLSGSSLAKGYASDGGDCGAYGSGYTYVASGLPFGHPYYTTINVGTPAKEGKLNVTYKVKIQDE